MSKSKRQSASVPFPPRSFKGWRIVKTSAAIQMIQSGLFLNVFSDYAAVFREQFGWDRSALSWSFAMTRAESGLLGPIQGAMIERLGPRRVIRLGAVLFAAGWIGISRLDSLLEYFIAYFVIAVGASFAGFFTLTSAMVNWFHRRRASALSLGQAGFAAGGMLTPAVAWFLGRYGWRPAALITGIVGGTVFWTLARFVIQRPSDVGEHVDGVEPTDENRAETEPVGGGSDFTASEALRTQAFWLISFGHGTALLVVSTVLANRAIYLIEQRGWGSVAAGSVGAAIVLAQFVGMLLGGYLGDLIDKRRIAAVAMGGHALGLLIFAHASSAWMVWVFVPLHGLSWGARGPLMQALRADYFGPRHFPKIMGYSSMIVMFGMMLGGPIAATIADRSGGSFTPGFTLLAGLCGLGALWFLRLRPPERPQVASSSAGGA